LDDHASLYSRDKRGREILRRPVLEREDKELIATVRLGETIYRGEVFVKRDELEALYNSQERPYSLTQWALPRLLRRLLGIGDRARSI
jgi:hypothetical protein